MEQTESQESSVPVPDTDIAKLHDESLQLRNQQFFIGTLALTGSGLSAWIAPGISAVAEGKIEQPVLIGATLSWLVILVILYILFLWSLALKKIITVISAYLKASGSSPWEEDYHEFSRDAEARVPSQTRFVLAVFLLYGVIVVIGSLIATLPGGEDVTAIGCVVLCISLPVYMVVIYQTYARFRIHTAELEERCRKAFAHRSRQGGSSGSRNNDRGDAIAKPAALGAGVAVQGWPVAD